jgi:hypothetical protein
MLSFPHIRLLNEYHRNFAKDFPKESHNLLQYVVGSSFFGYKKHSICMNDLLLFAKSSGYSFLRLKDRHRNFFFKVVEVFENL